MKAKKNLSVVLLVAALLISSLTCFAQDVENINKLNEVTSTNYNVISRLDISPRPAGFQPAKAEDINGAYNENVITTSNRVLNEETIMLKKASVQPVGEAGFSAWQLMCDEGGHTYEQSALNPLSYMVTGISCVYNPYLT